MSQFIKKIILFFSIILFTLLVVVSALFLTINKKSKTTTIAFYDIPEEYQDSIKENINIKNTVFTQIDEKTFLSEKLHSKADIVISWNCKRILDLSSKSENILQDIQNMYSNSVKNSKLYTDKTGKMTILPVLFDQFEFGVLGITHKRLGIKLPQNIVQIEDFCNQVKPLYPLPMIITGADDTTLNSLISLMIQSYGGMEGYMNVAQQLAKTTDFSAIYNYKIGGEASENLTIRSILDQILEWQNKGFLDSKWAVNTVKSTNKFVENGIAAVSFMNMSEQRNKPKPNANHYEIEQFPLQTASVPVSIQPVLVAVELKRTSLTKNIFKQLSSVSVQEKLSEQTKLAPAILKGEAYDSLASIARYNAVSNSSGPVPDLGTLCFLTKQERHNLAQAIRQYFGNAE